MELSQAEKELLELVREMDATNFTLTITVALVAVMCWTRRVGVQGENRGTLAQRVPVRVGRSPA